MTDLPPSWFEAALEDIAEVRLGRQRSPRTHTGTNMRPYLRAANVTWHGLNLGDVKEMHFEPAEVETYRLKAGDVLVAEASGSRSGVGKPAIWRGELADCCFQNTLLRVRSRGPLPAYLLHFLKFEALSGRLGDAARGVGIHHLGAAGLARYHLPVPPIEEQHRIVAAIEEQFSRLDNAVHSLERVIRNLQRLRLAVIRSAVAAGIDGAASLSGSAVVRLGDVAAVAGGKTPKAFVPVVSGEIPFYKVGDMNSTPDRWMRASRTYVDEIAVRLLGLKVWPCGTVIHPKQGGAILTNKKRILSVRAVCDLNTMGIVPSDALDADYLWLLLESVDLAKLADGSVVLQIKPRSVASLRVVVPTRESQRRICDKAFKILSIVESMDNEARQALRRGARLRSSLLAAAFSGQLTSPRPKVGARNSLGLELVGSPQGAREQ
jgi:type I restriction enzyme S subunit